MRGILRKDHILAPYTSWKIGGVAHYFYEPQNRSDLISFLQNWRENPIVILGAGTNILVSDKGVEATVVYLREKINDLQFLDEQTIYVEAGVPLSRLVSLCAEHGMEDAMFLTGIPGTVGGALAMNAGAYEDSIWNHVLSVETVDRSGTVHERMAKDFQIGYRHAVIPDGEWFISANLNFPVATPKKAREKMLDILAKRRSSQPLDLPSCGSVFRNPPNDYAARLIEACSLKGRRLGGAEVSLKHANFILNLGGATSQNIEDLMNLITTEVHSKHGILLVPEVRILEKTGKWR
ncbi:MAG: UDP-N-acetylmuramate dehydrogenase [Gammaproteobacteria bacterium]